MVRAAFYDQNGVKKGAWSADEDEKLRSYIEKYGHSNWRELPRFAGLSRCGKSCRLRWMNYLKPELKHGNYTQEEDALILKLHEQFGNRWSLIASRLAGRTDNEIKNHWNTNLKKRAAEAKITNMHSAESSHANTTGMSECEAEGTVLAEFIPPHLILESSPLSPSTSSNAEFSGSLNTDRGSIMGMSNSSEIYEASSGDFWTEPFVSENMLHHIGYPSPSSSMARGGFEVPYADLLYDDTADLFYQVMQELP
ncbi:hypothetical protein SLE2022_051050 [Rubroshorea leprosula]